MKDEIISLPYLFKKGNLPDANEWPSDEVRAVRVDSRIPGVKLDEIDLIQTIDDRVASISALDLI
jgi:hypothetical protein